jgi:hypothetical protein
MAAKGRLAKRVIPASIQVEAGFFEKEGKRSETSLQALFI